jgi:hypothetical protein
MELVLSCMLGLGLAAAVGFRIFVPCLLVSLAAHTGHLQLSEGFQWLGTTPAVVMFGVATLLEITAYYLPWFDNLLDLVAGPAAVVGGTLLMASTTFQLDPLIRWPLAVIAGGGTAGVIQGGTASLRAASSVTTAGIGNPALATAETVGAFTLGTLAFLLPLVGVILAAVLVAYWLKKVAKRGKSLFRGRRAS